MSLGDDLVGALAELRAEAESRMRARYRITRTSGVPATDPDTGEVTHPDVTVYEGKGYSRYPGLAFENNSEVGGAILTVSRLVVRIPHGPVIRPGDVVEVLSDPDNPQMAATGTRLRVASIDDQSQATAQRLLTADFQSMGGSDA